MIVGDIQKQIAFDSESKNGICYAFSSFSKLVRLNDIYEAIKLHHRQLNKNEKKMLRDLFIMINPQSNDVTGKDKKEYVSFIVGYFLGRYAIKTCLTIDSENIAVEKKII